MKSYIYFFLLLFLFSSCYTPVELIKNYNPALLGVGLTYMPKPTSFDSVTASNYIGGGFLQGAGGSSNKSGIKDDLINMAEISFNRGHRFKNLNYAYGFDAFSGSYRNHSLEPGDVGYFKSKSVKGYQVKTSINTFKATKDWDFRFIGLDLAYSQEFGDFAQFRKDILGTPNFYAITKTGLFSAALNSEMIFRGKSPSNQYGAKFSLRNTFGKLDYQGIDQAGGTKSSISGSVALYAQLNHYFFILEASEGGRLNVGYRF